MHDLAVTLTLSVSLRPRAAAPSPAAQNLDAKKLDISVWKGLVELEDLELEPSALEGLGLPITVKAGSLKKLVLKVPWSSLSSKPVVATVDDVYLIVGPNSDFTISDTALNDR